MHIFAALLIMFAIPCFALDIKSRDGRLYRDVVVTGIVPDGVRVFYRDGNVTLDWRDFPAEFQQKYHYDAAKGRRNPKAAAKEAFEFAPHVYAEAQRAEAQRIAALKQAELERKAAEERERMQMHGFELMQSFSAATLNCVSLRKHSKLE